MTGLLQIAVSNALLVAAVAPLVWAAGRAAGRPALTHLLWVIVLLKLLTPPAWVLPIQLPIAQPTQPPPHAPVLVQNASADSSFAVSRPLPRWSDAVIERGAISHADPFAMTTPARHSPQIVTPIATSAALPWRTWLGPGIAAIWLAGSALCLVIALVRMFRFSRMLRFAARAPFPLQQRATQLASRLGLNCAPGVWIVPGPVCPMLWTVGRAARVLVPAGLWERLDAVQCDTILLHELAHYRRRDHWVRWIELAATTLYWWNPACWWARRELREAEEQCCDAWVLWAMPGTFGKYAGALLEAVEFISIRGPAGGLPPPVTFTASAVPALASGMGQFIHLKRRLTMLKHGNVARRRALTWGGLAAAFALGAMLLPIAPTLAQQQATVSANGRAESTSVTTTTTSNATVAPGDVAQLDVAFDEPGAKASEPATSFERNGNVNGNGNGNGNADANRGELRDARKQIAQLRIELREAQDRIAQLQQVAERAGNHPQQTNALPTPVRIDGATTIRLPGGQTTTVPGVKPDGTYRAIIKDQSGRTVAQIDKYGSHAPVLSWEGGMEIIQSSPNERLDRIEAQLKDLLSEVQSIRAQSASGSSSSTSTEPVPATTPRSLPANR